MAVTASITLSDATIAAEQKTTAALVVSNSGASTVYVNGIRPLVTPTGTTTEAVSVQAGLPGLGGAFTSSVAASGSTTFYFDIVPHAPQANYLGVEPAERIYDVGAVVSTSDGSVCSPSTTTLTVTYVGAT
jgi:hypothetical protein